MSPKDQTSGHGGDSINSRRSKASVSLPAYCCLTSNTGEDSQAIVSPEKIDCTLPTTIRDQLTQNRACDVTYYGSWDIFDTENSFKNKRMQNWNKWLYWRFPSVRIDLRRKYEKAQYNNFRPLRFRFGDPSSIMCLNTFTGTNSNHCIFPIPAGVPSYCQLPGHFLVRPRLLPDRTAGTGRN